MSKNIVFEGWLTKSPPTKRIWRTKWRRRWFALRQSGELPGQYFLDYYADRNCRRLKGTINLDLCEQVDAGLHMERSGGADPKLRGSVFTIQTQSRTYHLEADCEAEMEKWVDAICRVCGLRATDDSSNEMDTYQNTTVTSPNHHYECADTTGPYIPISECITGVRQDGQRAFTFDPNIVMRSRNRTPNRRVSGNRPNQLYSSQPHIRVNNADFSENDSNMSDDECCSLNTSQANIGPPVPPRPPKTLTKNKRTPQVETNDGRRAQEHQDPQETQELLNNTMQYCNLPSLPPAVDRALKPRHSSHSIGQANHFVGQSRLHASHHDESKADVLQYLDLDLHTSKPAPPDLQDMPKRNRMEVSHGKSLSAAEADSAYKTVDFLKTEAFNITRKDAEASRNNHH